MQRNGAREADAGSQNGTGHREGGRNGKGGRDVECTILTTPPSSPLPGPRAPHDQPCRPESTSRPFGPTVRVGSGSADLSESTPSAAVRSRRFPFTFLFRRQVAAPTLLLSLCLSRSDLEECVEDVAVLPVLTPKLRGEMGFDCDGAAERESRGAAGAPALR